MPSAVPSQISFWNSVPFFFGKVPVKKYATQEIPGDWCHVTLEKFDFEGKKIDRSSHYLMENSTGDLYGLQHGGPPTRCSVASRSAEMLLGLVPYTAVIVAYRLVDFFADVCELGMEIPSRLSVEFRTKGFLVALTGGIFCPISSALCSLAENLSRAVRDPFYALAMAFACVYGMVIPFEGMKTIARVEKAWHGGVSYKSDIRYLKGSLFSTTLAEDFCVARSGGVLFLGYCMQKRGNLDEKVQSKNRFTLVDTCSKETSFKQQA